MNTDNTAMFDRPAPAPTRLVTDPTDIWQYYPSHPALVAAPAPAPAFDQSTDPAIRAAGRSARITAWVSSTVALVLYPLSFLLGIFTIGTAIAGDDSAAVFGWLTVTCFGLYVIGTVVSTVAAIIATRSTIGRFRSQLVGIWVLVAIDLCGLALVGAYLLQMMA